LCGAYRAPDGAAPIVCERLRRPIFHKLDETICGHVFCSFLALGKDEPIGGGLEGEADLIASAERQLVRSEASWVLCSLTRFSACPRAK
jgi:hypothetical protein